MLLFFVSRPFAAPGRLFEGLGGNPTGIVQLLAGEQFGDNFQIAPEE